MCREKKCGKMQGNKEKGGTLMEPVIQKFRTSMGGFNRRDVLQFIEQSSAAHRRQVNGLEGRLAQAEEERVRLQTELDSVRDENGAVAAEEARVRASLEESTRSLAKLRGELSDTESKLAAARAELERLQAQVGELAPMAQSYEELKDRVATVELDAHRKAQATVDEARAEAEQLRGETREWLSRTMEQYAALRGELDEVLRHARAIGELEGQAGRMDELTAELKSRVGLE